jgi:preprotein translocase subunit SecE
MPVDRRGVMRAIALVVTLLALAYLFYAAVNMLGQALVFA